jgi:hypothetical protein
MEFNLQDLLKDHRLYHSEFQQDYFITTRSGGTVYGQYKQALREVYKRFRGLKGLYHERDMAKVDLEELIFNSKHQGDAFEIKRNKLNIAKSELDLIEMEKNIEDTEREFKRFYEQCVSLKAMLPELTDEVRRKLDKEMWLHKLKEICAVDFLSNGALKNTTVELINSIPKDDRLSLLELVDNRKQLLEWYWNKDEEFEIKKIDVDLQKLLD